MTESVYTALNDWRVNTCQILPNQKQTNKKTLTKTAARPTKDNTVDNTVLLAIETLRFVLLF